MFVLIYLIIFMVLWQTMFSELKLIYNYYLLGKCLSINEIMQKYALNLKHAIKNIIIYTTVLMVALYWTIKGCFFVCFWTLWKCLYKKPL